jgi:O-antigen/teichoic acid export membrane protein
MSLDSVLKGSLVIFVGTILEILINFFNRIILIRHITPSEYGIFSIAFVILNVMAIIGFLGLAEGIPRYIPYHKSDLKKTGSIIKSGIVISFVASFVVSLFVYYLAGDIAGLLGKPELARVLRVFVFAVPFWVMITIIIAIYRGFGKVEIRAYFQSIIMPLIRLLLFLIVIMTASKFLSFMYAFAGAIVVTCIAILIYFFKNLPNAIYRGTIKTSMWKSLLVFSLPLVVTGLISKVMGWTDTLVLGYYKASELVAIYNAASPLAQFIPVIFMSTMFIYLPIASELSAKNETKNIRDIYSVVTRWTFALTFPIFIFIILFAENIISILFGTAYLKGALALQILAFAFFAQVIVGPTSATLVAIGKPKAVMYTLISGAVVNIILNILFIPTYAATGAAVATTISLILVQVGMFVQLFVIEKINPFTKNYLKPILPALICILAVHHFMVGFVETSQLLGIAISGIIFFGIYMVAIVLTKSLDNDDIQIILHVEKKLGLNMERTKKIIRKLY